MSQKINARIYKFDNAKLLTIILVVIGSFAEPYTSRSDLFESWFVFVYSFHAPLFIFVAGLFSKKYYKGERFDIRKFTYYLILGFILKLLIYFTRLMVNPSTTLDLFGGNTMEWFIFVIAMYMLTSYLVRKLPKTAVMTASVVIGTASGFFPFGDVGYFSRYLVFMPFWFAGFYLSGVTVRKFTHQLNVKLASIAFMFIYFVLCFRWREIIYPLRMLFTGRNAYSLVPIEGCSFYHRLLCYGISAVLIIAVMSCMPNRKYPVLTHMGENTIGVYFWHLPIIYVMAYFGFFETVLDAGDPLWKLIILSSAAALTLILSLDIFSLPLKRLYALIKKLSDKACIITDCAVIICAAVAAAILFFK